MQSFESRQWQFVEKPFRPDDQPHLETILTIGNGLVGTRGTFEERYPHDTPTTYAAGVFNHAPGTLVPELVNLPNWLALSVSINGQPCRLHEGRILGYERTLDMRTGALHRGVLWLAPGREVLRLHFSRFASLANPHLLALRVIIQPLTAGRHAIAVRAALDGTVLSQGTDHWASLEGQASHDMLSIHGVTGQSGYGVAMAARTLVHGTTDVTFANTSDGARQPAHTATFRAAQNDTITVDKLVALHTTRDSADPAAAARATLAGAVEVGGYDSAATQHNAAWAQAWAHHDIVIEGDEIAQRAVRFCAYHLLIAAPQHEERVSIAAKTLSGPGYKGHVFWDTELFILPPFVLADPAMARRLLMYRVHNLPGARNKARAEGYDGAMFPWESTDTGEETTPKWANEAGQDGQRVRIWTGDNEQHISTDIAYAMVQYWQWSGDDDWFARYGAEVVLDTAKFWGVRAEYNPDAARYELRMQIGPDEYHENVDNSVFTNRMVMWHLDTALGIWGWLREHHPEQAAALGAQLDLTEARLAHWRDVAERMWVPVYDGPDVPDGPVLEQFENFFTQLRPVNLADWSPRVTNMDWILGQEAMKHTRIIKQADVVMLMFLLEGALGDTAFLERNWLAYKDMSDHGSSLSPSIHALVASRLGHTEEAYNLFMYSATIDLDDHKGNVRDGIHAAACGGVLQALLFGFCGLRLGPDGPEWRANMPHHWRRVAFTFVHRGQRHNVALDNPAYDPTRVLSTSPLAAAFGDDAIRGGFTASTGAAHATSENAS